MRVELHTDENLASVLPAWEGLFGRDPLANPALAPGFGEAWLRHWAPADVRPWVLAAYDGDQLAGLAALVLRRRGPVRTLLPLGYWVANWWDVLAAPGRQHEVARALAAGLAARGATWDALLLDTLVPGSPFGPALRAAGLGVHRRGARPYPAIELPASFDEYLTTLPRKRRTKVRRLLSQLDSGELRLCDVTDPGDLARTVAAWQELRGRWWRDRERDLNEDHTRPAFRAFTEAMLQRLVPAGRAAVWELRRGEELLGVSLNFCDERTFFVWLSGFEPAAAALSPGNVVTAEAIRRSILAGRTRFDFMLGDEDYKYRFGARDVHVPRLLVHSRRPRSLLTRTAAAAAGRVRT